MRLLAEIFIIGALIYLGWEQPFKQRLDQVQATVRTATQSVGRRLHSETAVTPQETVPPAATPTPTSIPFLRPIKRATPPPGA
jgi:hypothetical protein